MSPIILAIQCNAFLHSPLAQEVAARKALIDNGELLCVIALPGRLFPEEKAPMSIVVLVKGGTTRDRTLFIDAQTKGIDDENNPTGCRFLSESVIKSIVEPLHSWLEHRSEYCDMPGFCRAVPFQKIKEGATTLTPWTYTS